MNANQIHGLRREAADIICFRCGGRDKALSSASWNWLVDRAVDLINRGHRGDGRDPDVFGLQTVAAWLAEANRQGSRSNRGL